MKSKLARAPASVPSARYILVFGAEWLAFAAFVVAESWPPSRSQAYNLVWPGLVLLLVGAACVAGSETGIRKPLTVWMACLVGAALAGVDHVLKLLSSRALPIGAELQLVPGHLHFRHTQNEVGSWLLLKLGIGTFAKYAVGALAALAMVAAWVVYRNYSRKHHRRGYWPGLAIVFWTGGMLSHVVDVALRGAVVDFIGIPGIATVDLKDVFLTIGAACVFVEIWDNRGPGR